ncbi:MAG: Hsp20/alpha crystallin family protein [Chloroflexi bacterium]|nr:Hsp20/alpha crystallin family protein [Chloroflexota bacterium]
MVLQRWEPTYNLRRVDELFDRYWRGISTAPAERIANAPSIPIDIQETADAYELTATVAGFKKDDVRVALEDRLLTIKAEVSSEEQESSGDYLVQERRRGSSERSIRLPRTVDSAQIESSYRDGVLTVVLPKSKETAAREIEISVS